MRRPAIGSRPRAARCGASSVADLCNARFADRASFAYRLMSAMAPSIMPPTADWPLLAPHPGTISWQRAGDARLLLVAGYALLLQVSHPTVGAGVSEHSQFTRDPWGRLLRTLDYTYTMVYGGPHAAGEMGRRIRSFHRQIRGRTADGRRYRALEPEAYAWVHATLAEAIVVGHERFGRPFTDEQRARFWGEWRSLGRLLGVRERDLPADWPRFRDYFEQMLDGRLCHTLAVDQVLQALARPASPDLAGLVAPAWVIARMPLAHLVGLATVGLLPQVLRRRLGLRWTWEQELQLRALAATLRAATPLMPSWVANTGPHYLRWRQQAIARGEVASATTAPPAAVRPPRAVPARAVGPQDAGAPHNVAAR
jgi:uncharacterized protein (DUF2236 family)